MTRNDPRREAALSLVETSRLLRAVVEQRLKPHGMTRAQWVILIWLDRQPGLSQKELAELVEVEPITVARLIDRLEARGLVERRADRSDRRVWRLHLTEAATPVLAEVAEVRSDLYRLATAGVEPASLAILTEALRVMKANVHCHLRAQSPADQADEPPAPSRKVLA